MAEAQVNDTLFEGRLEQKLEDFYRDPLGAGAESYTRTSRMISETLRSLNRPASDGLILAEAYCTTGRGYYKVEEIGEMVSSTLESIGTSGLTGKMAEDVFMEYLAASSDSTMAEEIVEASNSTLETIKDTYHNVKFVRMLIRGYSSVSDYGSIDELSLAVNSTLRALHGAYFNMVDVKLLVDTYLPHAALENTGKNYLADLSGAVIETIGYAKQNKVQLRPLLKRLNRISSRATVLSDEKDMIFSARMLYDRLIGKGA